MQSELLKFKSENLTDHIEIYKLIWQNRLISRQQLRKATGLKLTTLVRIMNCLLERDLICAKNMGESSGGRKPQLYGINPQSGYIIGVDIARMYSKVALMDLNCNIIRSGSFGMYEDGTWEETLAKICSLSNSYCSDIDKKKILGIGVGVVGPINRESDIILNPNNFSAYGWNDTDICRDIEKKTGLPVFAENGANAAALAEYINGFFKSHENMAYVICGAGIRLSIIAGGRLLRNLFSYHEGFGHLTVEKEGRPCYCGGRGCMEAYASIPSIMKDFRQRIKDGGSSHIAEKYNYDLYSINFDAFCDAAAGCDPTAMKVLEEASKQFAVGLKSLVNVLNPGLVVLGGSLVTKCETFYKLSVDAAHEIIGTNSYMKTVFCRGNLDGNAAVIGAGCLVLNYLFNK